MSARRSQPPSTFGTGSHPNLTFEVPNEWLEAVARRAAELVLEAQAAQANGASRWLNTAEAARHIGAKPARIHELVARQILRPRRDGRRLLFDRAMLDRYLESSR